MSKRSALAAIVSPLVLAVALASATGARALPNALGSEVVGAQVDPATVIASCPSVRPDTIQTTVLAYNRGRLETAGGAPNFTGVDRDIDAELACGITPLLRLRVGSGDNPDTYPADPGAYAALLTALAAHERGRVERFAIENEVNAPSHWSDTVEAYFALVNLASRAIHAGNPDAIVLDSTFASGGITAVRVNELYQSGDRAGALALLQEDQVNELGGGPKAKTEADVATYLADPKVQKFLRFFDAMLANQNLFDAFQLHYYGPSQHLPAIIDMLRRHGMTKPIETWELNHRYLDGRQFDEEDFANEATRLFATAIGEGSRVTVFSRYADRAENGAIGLTDIAGGSHAVRFAFRTVVRLLGGAQASGPLILPGGAFGYAFERPSGPVAAFWALNGAPVVGRRLGIAATSAAVTGNQATRPHQVRLASLAAGPSPQFAEPDLPVLERVAARRVHRPARPRPRGRRIFIRVACPEASPFTRCAGVLRVPGRTGRKRVRLGSRAIALSRGRSHVYSVRLLGRGRPSAAVADSRPCPGGLRPCRSWVHLSRR